MFLLVALAVAASGAIGLIARAKVPDDLPQRQLVTAAFRLVAGLVLVVVALFHFASS